MGWDISAARAPRYERPLTDGGQVCRQDSGVLNIAVPVRVVTPTCGEHLSIKLIENERADGSRAVKPFVILGPFLAEELNKLCEYASTY